MCGVGGAVGNNTPINRVSIDKKWVKTSTRRDAVLDDVGIFFILLYEWFYLEAPFYGSSGFQ